MFLLDAQGVIRHVFEGKTTEKEVVAEIEKLIGTGGPASEPKSTAPKSDASKSDAVKSTEPKK